MKSKTRLTKLLSIMLALVMVVGMLPIAVLAAGSSTATADFSTDPTTALELLNGAKTGTTDSTWDNDTKTLTLSGVNFETTAATAVKLPDGATIVLKGENIIKSGSGSGYCYGINGEGSLTIQGTGTLNVTSGAAMDGYSYGICADNNLTIKGGTVTATGGAADFSYGIRAANDINISGGNVTGIGVTANEGSYGLYSYNNDINISGGTVTATGGTVTGDTETDGFSYGIRAYNWDINISGGTVIATGGAADYSYGTRADDDINITGGNVTGTGGAADVKSYGIRAADYINISDGNVTGIGGTANDGSYGLYVYNDDINISGGTVTAIGGAAYDSYGIYADCYINISGGNLIAKAEVSALNNANELPSVYQWRTSDSGDYNVFPGSAYIWSSSHTYLDIREPNSIITVAITGVDAPKSNTAFDTQAVCEGAGISNAKPTVTWDSSGSEAGYGKIYTASITLTASEGCKFADSTTATVNGNPATSVTKNANGTLTVTYEFPKTDKHNIELTLNTEIHDGDAVKNPTINSGYEVPICFFVEDTNKNGDFTDDKTLLLDKALVEEFIAQPEIDMTFEEFIAALKDEGLDDVKTEFTGGYDYSFIAMVAHNEEVSFDYDEDGKVTDAIVKVNGKDVTDKCDGGSSLIVNPGAYVFSAAKTYTVTFDSNGGTGTMADVTGISGEYTLPENGFTAPTGKQFKAWSVDGVEKAVGDKITVTADTTVKAVWENIPVTPIKYDILDGANSDWTQNSDGSLSIRGSGEFFKFVGVKVDGKSVDKKYYTVKEGSTIVTLKPEYLNTLTARKHTLEILWTDGTADTTFTVDTKPSNTDTKSPQTGDNSMMWLWIALLFVSGFGVVTTTVYTKKRKSVK